MRRLWLDSNYHRAPTRSVADGLRERSGRTRPRFWLKCAWLCVGAMIGLAETDRLARLKICASDECHWTFFDRSKPANRHSCSSSRCGNRQKTRAYRVRQPRRTSRSDRLHCDAIEIARLPKDRSPLSARKRQRLAASEGPLFALERTFVVAVLAGRSWPQSGRFYPARPLTALNPLLTFDLDP
jgi:hypothetical protein